MYAIWPQTPEHGGLPITATLAVRSVPTVTDSMAKFIAGLDPRSLPTAILDSAKWLLLDGVANTIAGADNAIARAQLDLFTSWGGAPQATVLGTGERIPAPHAAYLNASLANLLDFDDTYKTFCHPGATSIAPTLAVGELRHASGWEALAALIAGYEVQLRVMEAGLPTPERRRQIWGFSVWQTLGATAAAARLLRLDEATAVNALSLGAFNAPVPNIPKLGLGAERPGAWTKNNYGWAAMGGVLGALLAETGFRGNGAILDGPSGFWAMAGSDRFDAGVALDGLGEEFRFVHTSFKPYASCRWSHSSIDAAAEIATRLEPGEAVLDLEIRAPADIADSLGWAEPTDLVDAQFSIPHVVALELLGRSTRFGMSDANFMDADVVRLARSVSLHHDTSMDADFYAGHMPVRVTATTSTGRQIVAARLDASGSQESPVGHEAIWAKWQALVGDRLGADVAEELGSRLLALESEPDVASVVALVRRPS
jgi:2-methylcitrate dehydratase PrpD